MSAAAHIDPKTILVVDDEPRICDVLVFYLENAGYRTLVATGGNQGLKVIAANKVEAVVSDIRMPDGSGIELLQGLKERQVDLPILLIVAGLSDTGVTEAYAMGAEAMLPKPIKPDSLLERVAEFFVPWQQRWTATPNSLMPPGVHQPHFSGLAALGRGGVFIPLDSVQIPAKGSIVTFSITLAGMPELLVEGQGIVRWSRQGGALNPLLPIGIGVEFKVIMDSCRTALMTHIMSRKPRAFIPLA